MHCINASYLTPLSIHSTYITWQYQRPPPPPPSRIHTHTCTYTSSYTHTHTHTCPVVTSDPAPRSPTPAFLQAEMSALDVLRRRQEFADSGDQVELRSARDYQRRRLEPPHSKKSVNSLNLEPSRFDPRPAERAPATDPQRARRQHWREPLSNRAPLRSRQHWSGRLPVLAAGSNQSGGSQTQLPERVIEVEPQVKEKGFLSCMPCWPWSPCCRARSYIAAS